MPVLVGHSNPMAILVVADAPANATETAHHSVTLARQPVMITYLPQALLAEPATALNMCVEHVTLQCA